MGTLTNDLTRLNGEIGALRRARTVFLEEMAHSVGTIQTHVRTILARFHRARKEMARKAKADRKASVMDVRKSVSHLKRVVAELRHGFALDLKGAHRAWMGKHA